MMDNDMKQFQRGILTWLRQMKTGKAARLTEMKLYDAAEARAKVESYGHKKPAQFVHSY
ncbi:hypothetical protein [Pseudomonas caspiana]|uniref:hypothetical protein n=1 Tax=Pseudomonas caspiana TaxID=1451454 RepID=UPI0032EBE26A